MHRKVLGVMLAVVLVLSFSLVMSVPVSANTVESSTMIFEGTLTDSGGGILHGMIPMVVDGGFDIFAKNGSAANFGGQACPSCLSN